MTFSAVLAIVVLAGSSPGPQLCRGVENKIEPDMRILESDLSQSAAIEAADRLKKMIKRRELTGEFHFGALNQAKIVYGHILLRQAEADRNEFGRGWSKSRDSVKAFCTWLSSEGFWYD